MAIILRILGVLHLLSGVVPILVIVLAPDLGGPFLFPIAVGAIFGALTFAFVLFALARLVDAAADRRVDARPDARPDTRLNSGIPARPQIAPSLGPAPRAAMRSSPWPAVKDAEDIRS